MVAAKSDLILRVNKHTNRIERSQGPTGIFQHDQGHGQASRVLTKVKLVQIAMASSTTARRLTRAKCTDIERKSIRLIGRGTSSDCQQL
jgi:hypothetical protein